MDERLVALQRRFGADPTDTANALALSVELQRLGRPVPIPVQIAAGTLSIASRGTGTIERRPDGTEVVTDIKHVSFDFVRHPPR